MNDDCVGYIRKLERVTELIQGKWALQILCALRHRPIRLSQLKRLHPLASKKALRATLRSLEERKIIVRRDLSDKVLHVEYNFSDAAKRTIPETLDIMAVCGERLESVRQIASDRTCSRHP